MKKIIKNKKTNLNKKFLYIGILFTVLIIVVAIPPLLGIPTPLSQFKHERNLDKFAQELNTVPLPIDSKQIGSSYKSFGAAPTGNLCYYYVSRVIESDLSKEKLQEYFNEIKLHPAGPKELVFYEGKLRGSEPNGIGVIQPWAEPITVGSFFEGSKDDRRQLEIKLQNESREKYAMQHTLATESITDNTFIVFSSDYHYQCY